MSRLRQVLKEKDRVEKEERRRIQEEIKYMQSESLYKNSLAKLLKMVDSLLDCPNVNSVVLQISEINLPKFQKAMYDDIMLEYDVRQIDSNRFEVSSKKLEL